MAPTTLLDRINSVVGGMSMRAVGDATGHPPETARRYLQGKRPSTEFLAALCEAFGVSARWLLTGEGPMKQSEGRELALEAADPPALLGAIASAMDRLNDRVDRLEAALRTIEARVTAMDGAGGHASPGMTNGRGASREGSIPERAIDQNRPSGVEGIERSSKARPLVRRPPPPPRAGSA